MDARFCAGTITVLEGENGAGKSTLLGIVGGLIQPSGGAVIWEPESVDVGARRHAIGWVGHESSSYRDLTARENVTLVADVHGISRAAVAASLERVGAMAFADSRVGTLSRGQKQRIALARGIVHAPELLLLDEPFTGLDAKGSDTLEQILVEEGRRGAILLVVSHDRRLASRISGQSLLLERGRARFTTGRNGCTSID